MNTSFRFLVVLILFTLVACGPTAAQTQNPQVTEQGTEQTEAPTQLSDTPKNYFEGFPPDFQNITLPQEMIDELDRGGSVVPPPADPSPYIQELQTFADSISYDLGPYDLGKTVAYTTENGNSYIAVPLNTDYFKSYFKGDFANGELAGLIYDQKGAYAQSVELYEVRFFDDKAVLKSPLGTEVVLPMESKEFFWTNQDPYKEIPVAFFIKGSCYLCWSLDGRCGCLICR